MSGLSEFTYCKITLALRATPATTKTFYFSNRVVENDSVPFKFQPLLKSYSCGAGISGYLPKDTFGTVILDNQFSNHQEQFRFTDYLEEYEIIGQEIEFYRSYDEDLTTNGALIWRDRVSSYNYSTSNKTLSLTLKSNVLSKDLITYIVDNDWLNPVEGSLGKPLPFVIGEDVQVKPVLMTDSGGLGTTQQFGYATVLGDTFQVGGVQKYLAKDDQDRYVEVKSTASTSTAFYQWSNDSSGGYVALHDGEMASRINYDSSNVYIATKLIVRCEGATTNVGRTIEGEIVARIYKRRGDTGKPTYDPVDEIRINKTDFSSGQWESTSEFLAKFDLTKPLVMSHEHGYFVSLQVTQSPDNGLLRASTRDESGRVIQFRNDESRSNLDSWQAGTVTSGTTQETGHTFIMHFTGVTFTDYADGNSGVYVNDLGLAPAYVQANASAETLLSDDRFKLKDLDLVFEIDGIRDTSSGTITGVNNTIITDAKSILYLLDFYYNGTSWVTSSTFNSGSHSATHAQTTNPASTYYRVLKGKTSGITRKEQLISEIARNSQCLITTTGTRKYGAFFIGQSIPSYQTIYAQDCRTITFSATDQNAIITRALMFYDKKVIDENKNITLFDQQQRNYGSFLLYTHDDGGTGQSLLANAFDLYGDREMQNTDFNFIGDTTSAENVLNVLLRRHDMPHMFVTIDLPHSKFEDGSILAMDIGTVFTLNTPEMPSNQGSTSYDNFNPASRTNTTAYNYRADSYKCQVAQRTITKNENEALYTRLVCRVILSSQDVT